MPTLKLFGHGLLTAGDDIRTMLILHALFRIFQMAFSSSLMGMMISENISKEIEDLETSKICDEEADIEDAWTVIFSMSSFVLSVISFCLVWPMFHYSGMGTPTDPTPRMPLKKLIYFEVIAGNGLRVAVFTTGIIHIRSVVSYCECVSSNESIDTITEAYDSCLLHSDLMTASLCLFATNTIDLIVFLSMFVYFICCHEILIRNIKIEVMPSERKFSAFIRCFIGCAGFLTCGLFGGQKAIHGDYTSFSLMMSNYMNANGILDVTPSDLYVGLQMFFITRKRDKLETTNRMVKEHNQILERAVSEERQSSGVTKHTNRGEISEDWVVAEVGSDDQAVECVRKADGEKYDGKYCHGDTKLSEQNNKFRNDTKKEVDYNSSHTTDSRITKEMLSPLNPNEKGLINEAAHFIVFAHAAYTVAGYMLERRMTGFFRILCLLIRNFTCASPEFTKGDNMWNSHTIFLKALSGSMDEDIIYASFTDSMDKIPYMILLDHDWKSVVVTIRGTLTLESILTDINICPKELQSLGKECGFDGKGLYCHTGMLDTTEWVYRDMMSHEKLDKVMREYGGYKLRIVGHSLGAGVASILSIMLRPKYPQLRCIAFSPPGCVMSEKLADETTNFTTSYVVNDDIMARLSVEGFEDLRNSILEMISRIKISKQKVSTAIKKYDDGTAEGLSRAIDEIMCRKEDIKDSKFKRQVDKFFEFQSQLKEEHREHYIKLFPPGSIIQLYRTKDNVNSFGEKMGKHVARWAQRSDFVSIQLSTHFLRDHESVGVKKNIRNLAEESFRLFPPFSPPTQVTEP